MIINGYTLTTELNNQNSGFSKWGFAVKDGKEYFVKELITPVYPIDEASLSPMLIEQRRQFCFDFEERYKNFYSEINRVSKGNIVRVEHFFRKGSRYYVITEKVSGRSVTIEEISKASYPKKLFLLKTAANCFRELHHSGIVHFDVKPANILVKQTQTGKYTAKLIDFDSGFFKWETREDIELGGDLTYLAPETFRGICGEEIQIDEKADIFSLGLVFHEYMTGKLPYYDTDEYEYPYEAALDGAGLQVDFSAMNDDIGNTIAAMLDAEPEKRPSAENIINVLNRLPLTIDPYPVPVEPPTSPIYNEPKIEQKKDGGPFYSPGDL